MLQCHWNSKAQQPFLGRLSVFTSATAGILFSETLGAQVPAEAGGQRAAETAAKSDVMGYVVCGFENHIAFLQRPCWSGLQLTLSVLCFLLDSQERGGE